MSVPRFAFSDQSQAATRTKRCRKRCKVVAILGFFCLWRVYSIATAPEKAPEGSIAAASEHFHDRYAKGLGAAYLVPVLITLIGDIRSSDVAPFRAGKGAIVRLLDGDSVGTSQKAGNDEVDGAGRGEPSIVAWMGTGCWPGDSSCWQAFSLMARAR